MTPITIPRAVVEQALDALEKYGWVYQRPCDAAEALRAALAQPAPPQRKPLTEEEIAALAEQYTEKLQGGGELWHFDLFARAVEAAHGIIESEIKEDKA